MRPSHEAILRALSAAAEAGEPCPTDASLSQMAGLCAVQVSAVMAGLAKSGVIAVERVSRCQRRVTILATGRATASTAPQPRRHSGPRHNAPKPAPQPKPLTLTAVRESFISPPTRAQLMAGSARVARR